MREPLMREPLMGGPLAPAPAGTGAVEGEPQLQGELLPGGGGAPLAVRVTQASRISLRLHTEGPLPADLERFEGLSVRLGERHVRLGPCRLHHEPGWGERSGRLVFLEDVYDCRALVREQREVNLQGAFQNVPLVLGQRERLRPEFRAYVADATWELSVRKKFFDEQDRLLAEEPRPVAEAARQVLLAGEGRRFLAAFDAQLAELERQVRDFGREEHERHGFYLRRQAWEYLMASAFLRRTNLKPRGYPGDAEMMQMCYENRFVGESTFGMLLHKHPVETPAAQAVRNRRELIPRLLRDTLARQPHLPPGGLRFLSVASGPAHELRDIFASDEDFARLHCTLLDQDAEALDAARACIRGLEAGRPGARLRASFIQESVRTMLRTPRLAERFGTFHFVYSMGLFDYLTPPVARAVLAKVYGLLEPGGVAVVGNYHVDHPTRLYMEYWMDWVLYLRSEEQMLALAEGLPGCRARVSFDETRCQMFLHLERAA